MRSSLRSAFGWAAVIALVVGVSDAVLGLVYWGPSARVLVPQLLPLAATVAAVFSLSVAALLGLRLVGVSVSRAGLPVAFLASAGWAVAAGEILRSPWFDFERVALPSALVAVFAGVLFALGGRAGSQALTARWSERFSRASPVTCALCIGLVVLPLGSRFAESEVESASGEHAIRRVVLIVVDTLRQDHLSCYSPVGPGTPHMDAFAAQAIRFEAGRSPASWTLPAMCSILTGVRPSVHSALTRTSRLPLELPTLAEHMRAAGYRTAAFGQNPFLKPRSGLARGFQEYSFYPRETVGSVFGRKLLETAFPLRFSATVEDRELTTEALEWVTRYADEDFFLWLHYFSPHQPFVPEPEFRPPGVDMSDTYRGFGGRQDRKASLELRALARSLYAAEVTQVDAEFGRFLKGLERLGLFEDALIVLTSDHGEELWEHEALGHGHSFYEEVVRVPLILKLPRSPGGSVVTAPVSTEGIFATILQACGIDAPAAGAVEAPLPLTEPGASDELRDYVGKGQLYSESATAIVSAGWKYIYFDQALRAELFDLDADPAEQRSLADAEPDRLREFAQRLDLRAAEADESRAALGLQEPAQLELDRKILEELGAVGYVE